MKNRTLLTFIILFAFTFTIVHEYIFTSLNTSCSNINEYVLEMDTPTSHGDICDIHFEYHQSFLLPPSHFINDNISVKNITFLDKTFYILHIYSEFLKPPIA